MLAKFTTHQKTTVAHRTRAQEGSKQNEKGRASPSFAGLAAGMSGAQKDVAWARIPDLSFTEQYSNVPRCAPGNVHSQTWG